MSVNRLIIFFSSISLIFSECDIDEVELWDICYPIETTIALQYLDNTYGEIPNEICELVNLEILNLTVIFGNTNYVTGEIPECIGDLINLTQLWLYHNEFTGEIPSEIGSLILLDTLNLSRNSLEGTIHNLFNNLVMIFQ